MDLGTAWTVWSLRLYVRLTDPFRSERAQDMVEYAVVTMAVAVVIVLAAMLAIEPAFAAWAKGLGKCIAKRGGGPCLKLI